MGLDVVPFTTALARVFRGAVVARLGPEKKPRSAWQRFVYPAPKTCSLPAIGHSGVTPAVDWTGVFWRKT